MSHPTSASIGGDVVLAELRTCTILVDIQVKALYWTDVLHCKNFNNLIDKHTVLQEFSPGNIFASCLSWEKFIVQNFVH